MKRLRIASGFTFLEALIVILIVGILASVAIYSLNITRAMNRDAKRISDISVLRAGLSQYWLQKATYPKSGPLKLGMPGSGAAVLSDAGFTAAGKAVSPVFLQAIPTGPKAGEFYLYQGSASGYSIRFVTERSTVYGTQGVWYAHASGIDHDNSEK